MSSILITGGCGFIGSNLAVALRAAGEHVTVLDNLARRGSEILLQRVLEHGVKFQHGDIRNVEDLSRLRGDFDLVECSAEPSVLVGTEGSDAPFLLNNNLVGALNCFEWARVRQVGILFLSTSRVYPYAAINGCRFNEEATRHVWAAGPAGIGPQGVTEDFTLRGARSLYGATKLAAELVLQEYAVNYNIPALINRCGVVAGPWQLGKVDQGVFTFWLASHYFQRPLSYIGFGGQGKQVRDVLHVDDLTQLLAIQIAQLAAPDARWRGETFNVGGGAQAHLSLCEATELCADLTGHRLKVGRVPEQRPADVIWYLSDSRRAMEAFGWQPRHAAPSILQDTFTWLRGNDAVCRKLFC